MLGSGSERGGELALQRSDRELEPGEHKQASSGREARDLALLQQAVEREYQSEARAERDAERRPEQLTEAVQETVVREGRALGLEPAQVLALSAPEAKRDLEVKLKTRSVLGTTLRDKALNFLVGAGAGALVRGAVRRAVKSSLDFGTFGTGMAAGAAAGGVFEGGKALYREARRIYQKELELNREQLEGLSKFDRLKKVLEIRRERERASLSISPDYQKISAALDQDLKVNWKKVGRAALKGAAIGAVGGAAGSWLADHLMSPEGVHAAGAEVAREVKKETLRWAVPETQTVDNQHSLWEMTKTYLEQHGVENPSNADVLQATKAVAEASGVNVPEWGLTNGTIDHTAIQKGFTVKGFERLNDMIRGLGGTPTAERILEVARAGAAPAVNMQEVSSSYVPKHTLKVLGVLAGGAAAWAAWRKRKAAQPEQPKREPAAGEAAEPNGREPEAAQPGTQEGEPNQALERRPEVFDAEFVDVDEPFAPGGLEAKALGSALEAGDAGSVDRSLGEPAAAVAPARRALGPAGKPRTKSGGVRKKSGPDSEETARLKGYAKQAKEHAANFSAAMKELGRQSAPAETELSRAEAEAHGAENFEVDLEAWDGKLSVLEQFQTDAAETMLKLTGKASLRKGETQNGLWEEFERSSSGLLSQLELFEQQPEAVKAAVKERYKNRWNDLIKAVDQISRLESFLRSGGELAGFVSSKEPKAAEVPTRPRGSAEPLSAEGRAAVPELMVPLEREVKPPALEAVSALSELTPEQVLEERTGLKGEALDIGLDPDKWVLVAGPNGLLEQAVAKRYLTAKERDFIMSDIVDGRGAVARRLKRAAQRIDDKLKRGGSSRAKDFLGTLKGTIGVLEAAREAAA